MQREDMNLLLGLPQGLLQRDLALLKGNHAPHRRYDRTDFTVKFGPQLEDIASVMGPWSSL